MIYNFNGRALSISDAEIKTFMDNLNISKDEAIAMWLDDHDYTENAEQQALAEKAEANKPRLQGKATRERKQTARQRKENPEKRALVEMLADAIRNFDGLKIDNVVIKNAEKEITFHTDGGEFSVSLTLHRPPKEVA